MHWQLRSRTLDLDGLPRVMGILNVTPDSFSDGGKFHSVDQAVARALQMEQEGADIIDLGAESTRPFSEPVDSDEQLCRLMPVLERLDGQIGVPLSIDTQSARVAEAVLAFPCVEIINDVSGLTADVDMPAAVVRGKAAVCVMHMQGTPQTMQVNPHYDDVVAEIYSELEQRFDQCLAWGIPRAKICLDPGIGFGKTHIHNLILLRQIHQFLSLPAPVLVGHSRKGFIAHVLRDKTADRDAGTLGVSLALARSGIRLLRVHDVKSTHQALQMFTAAGGLYDE